MKYVITKHYTDNKTIYLHGLHENGPRWTKSIKSARKINTSTEAYVLCSGIEDLYCDFDIPDDGFTHISYSPYTKR